MRHDGRQACAFIAKLDTMHMGGAAFAPGGRLEVLNSGNVHRPSPVVPDWTAQVCLVLT